MLSNFWSLFEINWQRITKVMFLKNLKGCKIDILPFLKHNTKTLKDGRFPLLPCEYTKCRALYFKSFKR